MFFNKVSSVVLRRVKPIKTSGVTPTRSQPDRKSDICASSLHQPSLLGHPGRPGAQLVPGTKPPCRPSPRHWAPQENNGRFSAPKSPARINRLSSVQAARGGGGGGRKLLDQAQVRLSHAPAGKLGGSWGACGTFVIQLQNSDAINIWIWSILKPGYFSFRNWKYGCMKASGIWNMGVWKVARSSCFRRHRNGSCGITGVVPVIKIPDLVLSFSIPFLNNEKKKIKPKKKKSFGSDHLTEPECTDICVKTHKSDPARAFYLEKSASQLAQRLWHLPGSTSNLMRLKSWN